MSDIKTPYLNGHMYEFDLCWLVEKILSFESQLNQAIDLKTIHYADPIQWNITTQYAPNTVVVDPKTGTAYISKVPVPSGILLTNTTYWSVIFNYQDIYTKIMDGVAFYNGQTEYATKALLVNDLVWYGLDLYRVTRAIEEGGKLIPGTNLVKTSIESLLSTYYGRDRMAQVLNDTLNVTGDYTINAGDIAETCDNLTIKTKSLHVDSENPVFYKDPTINGNQITIPINSPDGKTYKIPLYNDSIAHANILKNTKDFLQVVDTGVVKTLGFYDENDGGHGTYYVTSDNITPDNMSIFKCGNDLYAILIPDDDTNILTVGGKNDGSGQSALLNKYFKYCVRNHLTARIPDGCTIGMDDNIFMPNELNLNIDGTLLDLNDIAIYNKDAYDDIRPVYTGNGNITIYGNGVIDARADQFSNHVSTTIRLMHGHDITIKGITLKNFGGYHGIEVIGCKNIIINTVNFINYISTPSGSEHADYESVIQIEAPYADVGQSGAFPFDKTPCENIAIINCTFAGDENKKINCGIESQAQSQNDTHNHLNIQIANNKFYNVIHHCIIPHRWAGCNISNNYTNTVGGSVIGNISGSLGYSLTESIVNNNILYDSSNDETTSDSGIFVINLHASTNVSILDNSFMGCKVGILALTGTCTNCEFANNNGAYLASLDRNPNLFFIENPNSICHIINNTLSTTTGKTCSLASLPPTNDRFNGIFLGNSLSNIVFQYRDNKLIGNADVIYTGTDLVTEITPSKPARNYGALKIVFTLNDNQWERVYNLDDDVKSSETLTLYNDSTSVLLLSYKVVIDTNTGNIYVRNATEKILKISGADSSITDTPFTAYVSKIVGIKNNLRS